jgi:hypothetical protein
MNGLELMGLGVSCISLLGLAYNTRMRIEGYYVWLVANIAWIPLSILAGAWYQTPIWVGFTIGTAYGIREWRRRPGPRTTGVSE